jgi:hypothetical protein
VLAASHVGPKSLEWTPFKRRQQPPEAGNPPPPTERKGCGAGNPPRPSGRGLPAGRRLSTLTGRKKTLKMKAAEWSNPGGKHTCNPGGKHTNIADSGVLNEVSQIILMIDFVFALVRPSRCAGSTIGPGWLDHRAVRARNPCELGPMVAGSTIGPCELATPAPRCRASAGPRATSRLRQRRRVAGCPGPAMWRSLTSETSEAPPPPIPSREALRQQQQHSAAVISSGSSENAAMAELSNRGEDVSAEEFRLRLRVAQDDPDQRCGGQSCPSPQVPGG